MVLDLVPQKSQNVLQRIQQNDLGKVSDSLDSQRVTLAWQGLCANDG